MTIQFRSGRTDLRTFYVDDDLAIAIGDMVFMDASNDEVKKVSAFTWSSDLATTQAGMANVFVGIAHSRKDAGVAGQVSVDVSPDSIYEVDCVSGTYKQGASLGAAKQSGDALENQKLAAAVATSAVARAAESIKTAATKIRCTFASVYGTGTGNTNAVVG